MPLQTCAAEVFRVIGKTLINKATIASHLRPGVTLAKFTGGSCTMSNAGKMLHASAEGRLFNQIVMFSVAGLCSSVAMALVGGFQVVVFPWF
jgi:hypothetical protein